MPRESKTMKDMKVLCNSLSFDDACIFHKAKDLLNIYKKVVWSVEENAYDMVCETNFSYGKNLNEALIYLYEFAPDIKRKDLENRVSFLFETKWLIDLVDKAVLKVRKYPVFGNEYAEILNLCYLNLFKYKECEILDILGMERSNFYAKKKEAIQLFGIALWGYALPEFNDIFKQYGISGFDEKNIRY